MIKGLRIKTNPDGLRQALQSDEVQRLLQKKADQIAEDSGDGFEPEVKVRGGSSKLGRAMGYVRTETVGAKRDQARNNTLQRAANRARQ